MAKHHIIYVPGILDDIYHAQGILVAAWIMYGVRGHCHPMPWAGDEAYEPKLQRLLRTIDELVVKGRQVSLVGASAGASAVLNAYAQRREDISGLVYICGKINDPETVSDQTYADNPAFKTSLYELQTTLKSLTKADKAKLLSLYSPGDKSVLYAATTIPGVPEQALPKLRHGRAIIYSLSLGAYRLIRHLKQTQVVKH